MRKKSRRRSILIKATPLITVWILGSLVVGGIFGYELATNPEIIAENKLLRQIGINRVLNKKVEATAPPILPKNVELCFTPPSGCSEVIVRAISKAQETIYVQAYGMTSPAIVEALVKAKSRGVKVRVLLDKSNLNDKWTKIGTLLEAEIEVGIDRVPGIAHNKVMIIDERYLITGSFNFTRAADTRNAENVLIIDDTNIAKQYLQNWLKRKAKNQSKN